jgi:SAM-dependent methyltransferase
MEILDKRGVLANLDPDRPIALELGCGSHKRRASYIGVDMLDYDEVDVVGDAHAVLARIPDSGVRAISSYHFLEHVQDLSLLLDEVARVLRPSGAFEVVVPHFSNPYFYSDLTHRNSFGLYTFSYLAQDALFSRRVPHYANRLDFELRDVKLGFKSARPFYVRYAAKTLLSRLFNLNRYMQEFYEENLCYLLPCYEIRYLLRRLPLDERPVHTKTRNR